MSKIEEVKVLVETGKSKKSLPLFRKRWWPVLVC